MGAPGREKPNDKKILIEEYIAKTQSRENNYEQHLLAGATATSQACTKRGWAKVRCGVQLFSSKVASRSTIIMIEQKACLLGCQKTFLQKC